MRVQTSMVLLKTRGTHYLQVISILFCLLSFTGCETRTKIHIQGEPLPEIYLSGSGTLAQLFINGPYSEKEFKPGGHNQVRELWQLDPNPETRGIPLDKLPKIIYGKVPTGFKQVYPKNKAPEVLEEGKYYNIITPSYGAADNPTTFMIKRGKVVEIP